MLQQTDQIATGRQAERGDLRHNRPRGGGLRLAGGLRPHPLHRRRHRIRHGQLYPRAALRQVPQEARPDLLRLPQSGECRIVQGTAEKMIPSFVNVRRKKLHSLPLLQAGKHKFTRFTIHGTWSPLLTPVL